MASGHRLFAESVDQSALLAAVDVSASEVRTPLMFEFQLMERARSDRKHIVLPESQDDRILEAADILLRRGVADLTLLGDETKVRARGSALGLRHDVEAVVHPVDKVHVGHPRRPEHDGIAGRAAEARMRRQVGASQVPGGSLTETPAGTTVGVSPVLSGYAGWSGCDAARCGCRRDLFALCGERGGAARFFRRHPFHSRRLMASGKSPTAFTR